MIPAFTEMPNQRQSGTKLAGAYISAEKDAALAQLAVQKGFHNKADFIRTLFDDALTGKNKSTEDMRSSKEKTEPQSKGLKTKCRWKQVLTP